MKGLVDFLSRQRLTVSLGVFLLCIAGTAVMVTTNREVFPNVNFDMVSVQTIYPGGSPADNEQLISVPIEKNLRGVSGIDKVRSYNVENVSIIVIYIDPDARNKVKIVDDIKDAVESVDNLPESAERPIITEFVMDKFPVMDIALSAPATGDEGYRRLRETARRLESVIYDIEGIAAVVRMGYHDREFLVEVYPEKLARYRIGLNTVINTLRSGNVEMPGGVLRLEGKEILLRTLGKFRSVEDVMDTVITANDLGYAVRIGDVATVRDTFKEPTLLERFNGRNAIVLQAWQREAEDMINVADRLKAALDEFRKGVDRDIEIAYFNDFSRFVRSRLSSLGWNAVTGFVLLAAILFLMLGSRMSLLVSTSLPITFMAAFVGMRLSRVSLNIVSMFALVMVLGMIVDFAIVVAENSYRHMESGKGRVEAVRLGVSEVFWPVTVTLICICAAFAPLLFMTGLVGKITKIIPQMIMLCLSASWFAAMFVLPSYLTEYGRPPRKRKARETASAVYVAFRQKYRTFLAWSLSRRYLTLGILAVVLVASTGIGGAVVGFVFFPGGGAEAILLKAKMPIGTTLAETSKAVGQLEKILGRLPGNEVDSIRTTVGIGQANVIDPAPSEAGHRATVIINLAPETELARKPEAILAQLREDARTAVRKGQLNPELEIEFKMEEHGPPVGMPVNVELRGEEFAVLGDIAEKYRKFLESVEGVTDVVVDLEHGKEEYRYRADGVKAARSGLSLAEISQALHAAFAGTEATAVTMGDDEIAVRVRFPERYRHRKESLDQVVLENPQGGLVRIRDVASFAPQPGYSMINRLNYRRIVQVKANVDKAKITSIEVNRLLQKEFAGIEEKHLGYSVNYGGEQEDMNRSMANLVVLFVFALLAIYCVLAVFFSSLLVPVVVMSAVPFAFVGVILALLTHLQPLSFMGFLGFVSLTGVVVSNTLVLVQFIQYRIAAGSPLKDALVEAGVMRLRPVLLTSGTTVLALLPTTYGIGGKDPFVAPLALTFGYGLVVATFVTLILIPCLYLIADDLKGWFARR